MRDEDQRNAKGMKTLHRKEVYVQKGTKLNCKIVKEATIYEGTESCWHPKIHYCRLVRWLVTTKIFIRLVGYKSTTFTSFSRKRANKMSDKSDNSKVIFKSFSQLSSYSLLEKD